VHAIRGAIALILWEIMISTHGSRDDIIHLQPSQVDMASRRFIESTRKNQENVRLPHVEGSGRMMPLWI
jgi:hypothetical protein